MVWWCREGRTIWYGGVEKGGPYGGLEKGGPYGGVEKGGPYGMEV